MRLVKSQLQKEFAKAKVIGFSGAILISALGGGGGCAPSVIVPIGSAPSSMAASGQLSALLVLTNPGPIGQTITAGTVIPQLTYTVSALSGTLPAGSAVTLRAYDATCLVPVPPLMPAGNPLQALTPITSLSVPLTAASIGTSVSFKNIAINSAKIGCLVASITPATSASPLQTMITVIPAAPALVMWSPVPSGLVANLAVGPTAPGGSIGGAAVSDAFGNLLPTLPSGYFLNVGDCGDNLSCPSGGFSSFDSSNLTALTSPVGASPLPYVFSGPGVQATGVLSKVVLALMNGVSVVSSTRPLPVVVNRTQATIKLSLPSFPTAYIPGVSASLMTATVGATSLGAVAASDHYPPTAVNLTASVVNFTSGPTINATLLAYPNTACTGAPFSNSAVYPVFSPTPSVTLRPSVNSQVTVPPFILLTGVVQALQLSAPGLGVSNCQTIQMAMSGLLCGGVTNNNVGGFACNGSTLAVASPVCPTGFFLGSYGDGKNPRGFISQRLCYSAYSLFSSAGAAATSLSGLWCGNVSGDGTAAIQCQMVGPGLTSSACPAGSTWASMDDTTSGGESIRNTCALNAFTPAEIPLGTLCGLNSGCYPGIPAILCQGYDPFNAENNITAGTNYQTCPAGFMPGNMGDQGLNFGSNYSCPLSTCVYCANSPAGCPGF